MKNISNKDVDYHACPFRDLQIFKLNFFSFVSITFITVNTLIHHHYHHHNYHVHEGLGVFPVP